MFKTEEFIQRTIHAAEVGRHSVWMRRILLFTAAIGLCVFHLLYDFRGLATSQAMEQAQIGRELARGEGWSTKMARPLAAGTLESAGKDPATAVWLDTYHAPLPPLLNALALLTVKDSWQMQFEQYVPTTDRAIATMSVFLFLASIGVLYLIAARLFDDTLAWFACGLVLVCDTMWKYAVSGLPQMLLLLLLHLTVYALLRAVEARNHGEKTGGWLAAASLGFGLLALSHALTIWLFLPALAFCIFYFRPRARTAVLMLAIFGAVYTPWLVRNYTVSGNPFGLAIYAVFDGIGHSEPGLMRSERLDLATVTLADFRGKIRANLLTQFDRIFQYLGWSFVAPVAAVSLLHAFRRRETAHLRWLLFAMWLGAVLGMAVVGMREEQNVAANQFHLLFAPLFTCYGMAFLLVLWNRLNFRHPFFRRAFLLLLFVLCGLPTLLNLLAGARSPIRWPPYIPLYISDIGTWMKEEELTSSDMPWAVAWYADRRCVWLPQTIKSFNHLNDFRVFGHPITGLYLTPVSGSENKLGDLHRGEYRDWAPLITRTAIPDHFPLKWAIRHGTDECVFYADHDRRRFPSR